MSLHFDLLLNSLNSINVPNLLVYGDVKINKLALIKSILNNKYKITKELEIKEKNIEIVKTNLYYVFNVSLLSSKNIFDFIDVLKKYISLKDYYSEHNNRYVILNNFINVKISVQNILRVFIEKYRSTSVFILLTSKVGNIIDPLKSRCLMIRIPLLTDKQKRCIFYENSTIRRDVDYEKTFDFIYKLNDSQIIKNCILNKTLIENYKTPYNKIIEKIITLYDKSMNKSNLTQLKSYAYNILRYDLSVNLFYIELLDCLLQKSTIRDKKKIKLIKYFADSEYNYNNSYRSIIVIESLLIYCYNLSATYK